MPHQRPLESLGETSSAHHKARGGTAPPHPNPLPHGGEGIRSATRPRTSRGGEGIRSATRPCTSHRGEGIRSATRPRTSHGREGKGPLSAPEASREGAAGCCMRPPSPRGWHAPGAWAPEPPTSRHGSASSILRASRGAKSKGQTTGNKEGPEPCEGGGPSQGSGPKMQQRIRRRAAVPLACRPDAPSERLRAAGASVSPWNSLLSQ